MAWDSSWEKIFREREHWGLYPPEELVRFVARYFYSCKNKEEVRFLDLGAGMGSASWYLAREGFQVDAIDGSKTALQRLEKRFENEQLSLHTHLGDIENLPFEDATFDCVVELHCLMCNTKKDTIKILQEIYRVLKPGGRLFSVTPQVGSWGSGIGDKIEDGTYGNASEGPYQGMGVTRFTAEADIENIYGIFDTIHVDTVERSDHGREQVLKFWVLHCEKPA